MKFLCSGTKDEHLELFVIFLPPASKISEPSCNNFPGRNFATRGRISACREELKNSNLNARKQAFAHL
jgi:hypothetical protein